MKNRFFKYLIPAISMAVLSSACDDGSMAEMESAVAAADANALTGTVGTNATSCYIDSELLGDTSTYSAGFTSYYYDLDDGSQSFSSSSGSELTFSGAYNADISASSGYYLGWIDITDVDDLTDVTCVDAADVENISGTFGLNGTSAGWYNYNQTTHATTPVEDRFLVVWEGSSATSSGSNFRLVRLYGLSYTSAAGGYYSAIDIESNCIDLCD